MNMTLLNKDSGYIPSYKRTKLTDELHSSFGLRTDFEFISKALLGSGGIDHPESLRINHF